MSGLSFRLAGVVLVTTWLALGYGAVLQGKPPLHPFGRPVRIRRDNARLPFRFRTGCGSTWSPTARAFAGSIQE